MTTATATTTDQLDVGAKRRSITLAEAWTGFWRHPSPTLLIMTFTGAIGARLAVGDWNLWDLWLPMIMIAVFPIQEWLIHVVLLHWKPIAMGRWTLDSELARKHREHHADPRNVPLIFIPVRTLLVVLPLTLLVAIVAFPTLGRGLTYLVTAAGTGIVYEWTHYLIHSDYRPSSRVYRAIWRNHRLHHYKNERYWFTVTTAHTADTLLRTDPDPGTIERSPTARNLLGV